MLDRYISPAKEIAKKYGPPAAGLVGALFLTDCSPSNLEQRIDDAVITKTPAPTVTMPHPTLEATVAYTSTPSREPSATTIPIPMPTETPTETPKPTPVPTFTAIVPTESPREETPATTENQTCAATHLDSPRLENNDIETQIALLKELEVAWTRFDIEWAEVETSPGNYDFKRFDMLFEQLSGGDENSPIVIATLPQWAQPGKEYESIIETPEQYATYAGEIAKHFKGNKKIVFQLGNEPDYRGPDKEQYAQYVKSAAEAIKTADPEAYIVTAGVVSEHAEEWVTAMYDQGALDHVDAIGLHLYSQPDPPRYGILDTLQGIIKKYNGKQKILISEFGWPTVDKENAIEGVSQEDQAIYTGDVFATMREQYRELVKAACVYNLRDNGDDPKDPYQNFGMVKRNYKEKPVFFVVKKASQAYR